MRKTGTLAALLLIVATPAMSFGISYCNNTGAAVEWKLLLQRYPEDEALHRLYTYRQYLCARVEAGALTLEEADRRFERRMHALIEKRSDS